MRNCKVTTLSDSWNAISFRIIECKSFGFVSILRSSSSPVMQYKMLWNVFEMFNSFFLGRIPVPADNESG